MKEHSQIIRLDGRNTFLEVMNSAFVIGKVQINFIEYDVTADKGNRIKQQINIYVDIDKLLLFGNDVLTGRMNQLGKMAREEQIKKGFKYSKEIWLDLGGISAKLLIERGKARSDGKSLSRQMKLTPGEKLPWIISAEEGAGEETETGLIVPKYVGNRAEKIVRVPLSNEDLKRFVLITQAHIEGFIGSQYQIN
ncbi:hypothetical protein [Bacillus massilinigeriensis]|uniref:hypothetical protein n=1 Tax=Bacillus massilionigeriensis TaxID=1805475 RepID=UPI00096B19B8|nr:hypothetical protein [Bacillus massilionigeriensis]